MRFILITFICLSPWVYEIYKPRPNFDLEQWKHYNEKTILYSHYGVPKEVLIFYRIDSNKKFTMFVSKYKHLVNKPIKVWVKSLNLSPTEIRSLYKFQSYEKGIKV
jgi:hypothetical protein